MHHRVHVRRLSAAPEATAAYRCLFAARRPSFWLDSSAVVEGFSRFSFLGDAAGPFGEYLTYRVSTGTATVRRAGQAPERCSGPLLELLDRRLRLRTAPVPEGLPFEFNLGYVGYLGYELRAETAPHQARPRHGGTEPDAALLFADRMLAIDHREGTGYLLALAGPGEPEPGWLDEAVARLSAPASAPRPVATGPFRGMNDPAASQWLRPRHDEQAYRKRVECCLDEIRRGETYEVNLTNEVTVQRRVAPLETYEQLRRISPVPHGALLDFPDVALLSASPERFLRIDTDATVEAKPIKGTRPRGRTAGEDEALRTELRASPKDRAENLMIVDLMRNDLGTCAEPGSVHVPALFDVESYSSVHHLVSTVRARLHPQYSPLDCVRAAFPGGSMTGAPKVRTMAIIDELEDGPRGAYSGAFGWFSLSGATDLAITIRTLVVHEDHARFGVGGAVVADSDPDAEFAETVVKSRALVTALFQDDAPSV